MSFEAGSWVWVPDEKEMYLPGKVVKSFKPGEEGKCKMEDGRELVVPAKSSAGCIAVDEAALQTHDNLIKLNNLNEPTILHNLRQRFIKDAIYTYVSSILVACNPFKLLPIYTPEIMDKYKDGGGRTQPPHIYAVADNSYRNLLADFRDQAVVISGESGAGKTETMKLVLQFLADVSGRAQKQSASGEKVESLEQQILKSNPVMEAFGNAKTTRNNNSSRFGKWTEIKFNRMGTIVGGSIINYLLEKSRIPWQAQQERNYHIFYQLLAGAELDLSMKKNYKLKDAEEFRYMNQSGVTTVDGINDEKDWLEMTGAMDVLNMTADEKEQVFRLVAGLLQLGNVEFDRDPKGSEETDAKVKNTDQMALASDLLKVDAAAFAKSLCFKKISRPGSKSVTYAHYSIAKATDARDVTSKFLYCKLFDWLILKINAALSGIGGDGPKGQLATIGVLDIFGFESFATNSFEQLCINYCNEKLQFHFNEYIFKLEQEEYKSEGVPVEMIEFKDNKPTLELLEAKSTGIFAMIDEEINVPKGSDETLLKKVLTKHEKHSNFAKPKPKDLNAHLVFIVVHYAGAVPYNVTGFLEKNKDTLHEDIVEVVLNSKDPLIKWLVKDEAPEPGSKAPKKKVTLGGQFKASLEGLMTSLYRCEPHFVRCMKSNHQKKGNIFESEMMMAQLRYAGLLEVCRIRQIGFPVRKKFDEFLFRYRCLDLTAAKDHKTLCEALSKKKILEDRQWVIGHTKVFMRNLQQTKLEEARENSLKDVVKKMQALARKFICRCRYLRYKVILKGLKEAVAKRTEEALEAALSEVAELPFGGSGLALVKQARALKERLEEERRVHKMAEEAVKARDLAELKNAVKAADDLQYDPDVVKAARKLRDLMEREKAAVKRIKDAIPARDLAEIKDALKAADEFGSYVVDTDAYREGVALKDRLEAEVAARQALKTATTERDYHGLEEAVNKLRDLGIDDDSCKDAIKLMAELEEHAKAIDGLRDAIKERALDQVQAAIKKAQKVALPETNKVLKEAVELEKKLQEEKEVEDELHAAAESKDQERIEKALRKAQRAEIPDTSPGVKKCNKVLDQMKAEAEARSELKKSLKSGKASTILAALNKCNDLGMECKEMEDARDALAKLGKQAEAIMKLQEAVKSGDLEAIEEQYNVCFDMGLGDDEEVRAARDAKKKITKQNKAAEALEAALKKKSKDGIREALAATEPLNMATRFADLLERANKALATMDLEDSIMKQMKKFVENGDEDALDDALDKAKAAGCSEAVFERGEEARKAMGKRKDINRRLADLLDDDDKDKEAIQALVDEATEMGYTGGKVAEAKKMLLREKKSKEVKKALKKALKSMDDKALGEAIAQATEIGMEGKELAEAKEMKTRLEEEKELAAGVRAAMKALAVKAESKAGVSNADLEPLISAMSEAKAMGLGSDSPFMVQAKQAKERIEAVLSVQAEIAKALESDSLRVMKRTLDKAEDLDLGNSSLVKKLKARVREMEKARSKAALEDEDGEAAPSLDDEEMRRIREERLKKAQHPKYQFGKYNKIRSADDFAKGVLLNKKKIKASMLRWQPSVIPTSIMEHPNKDFAKFAIRVHKCVLGYTGDKSMSFPATLAQDILQKGLEIPELVDEIYIQLCKHLTQNPRPESAVRGWQLMCMCVGTFPPSRDFENYLVNFILEHKDGAGAIGNYARYSLRRLEGIMNSGPSGFVPSVEEIMAYKERPPILATIELVDGTPLTEDLPITPDLSVAKVVEICVHFLELQDPRQQYFGIFVEDIEDPTAPKIDPNSDDAPPYAGLPKTPRPLQNENFMGDVVTVKVRQNQPFKFVFKRKIFLKNLDGPSDDPMFERLIYLQSVDEVVNGNIPVDTAEQVAKLVCQSMVVDLGDDMPETEADLVAADLVEYVPKPWRTAHSSTKWAKYVLAHREPYMDLDPEQLQHKYVDAVRDHPLYGTCFFHVRRHKFPEQMDSYPDHVIIALNSEGLHFLNEDRETLASYGYADIYRWGGSSTQFSIIIWNAETQDTDDVSMFTSQAADMAALILDYINAIMATTEQ